MTDYISREAAIKRFSFAVLDCLGMEPTIRAWDITKALESIPAAEVRPVVRGKWTRIDYEPHSHDYKCSACGWKNDMPTHFCPNCGAEMGVSKSEMIREATMEYVKRHTAEEGE